VNSRRRKAKHDTNIATEKGSTDAPPFVQKNHARTKSRGRWIVSSVDQRTNDDQQMTGCVGVCAPSLKRSARAGSATEADTHTGRPARFAKPALVSSYVQVSAADQKIATADGKNGTPVRSFRYGDVRSGIGRSAWRPGILR